MSIPFCDLKAQYETYRGEIDAAMQEVLEKTAFIMGPQVKKFEEELSSFCGAPHSIGCANGTDALVLALKAIGIEAGDEVIVPAFSFFASAEAVSLAGGTPVFAEVLETDFNLDPSSFEQKITSRTKAVIPVSLYGQPADMETINQIAEAHGIVVLEDAAQSFGGELNGRKSCNLSTLATTSFFPSKPLGGYGDGGAVFTCNDEYAEKLKMLRVHGWKKRYYSEIVGTNSRLDTLQAAILSVKLKHFPDELKTRQKIAARYTQLLGNIADLKLPVIQDGRYSAWAQYTIRVQNRSEVAEKLKEDGVPTAIHYPIPLYRQPAYKDLKIQPEAFPISETLSNEVLSLPFSAFLTEEQQDIVVQSLKKHLNR